MEWNERGWQCSQFMLEEELGVWFRTVRTCGEEPLVPCRKDKYIIS